MVGVQVAPELTLKGLESIWHMFDNLDELV